MRARRVHSSAVERSAFDIAAVVRHDIVDDQLTQHAQLRSRVTVIAQLALQHARLHVLHLDLVLVAVKQLTRVLEPVATVTAVDYNQ